MKDLTGSIISYPFYDQDEQPDGVVFAYVMWDPMDGSGDVRTDQDGMVCDFTVAKLPPTFVVRSMRRRALRLLHLYQDLQADRTVPESPMWSELYFPLKLRNLAARASGLRFVPIIRWAYRKTKVTHIKSAGRKRDLLHA
jgi:hypothetical protein